MIFCRLHLRELCYNSTPKGKILEYPQPYINIGVLTRSNKGAFYNCSSLTSITIPSSVTSIRQGAFQDCSSLTSINLPDGVTSIGRYAFNGCSSLTSITIPDSVKFIGNSAFYNCRLLTDITYEGTKAQWESIEKGYSWNNNTGNYTVHCTDGDISKS